MRIIRLLQEPLPGNFNVYSRSNIECLIKNIITSGLTVKSLVDMQWPALWYYLNYLLFQRLII